MNPLPPLLLCVVLLAACGPALPPMPPAPTSTLSVAAVRADSDQRFSILLDAAAANDIFSNYATDRPSPWGGNFTRRLNFTGVAWDDSRTATLVTPEHVVMAAHYRGRRHYAHLPRPWRAAATARAGGGGIAGGAR